MFLSIPQPATHLRVFFSIILYTGVVIACEAMSPAFQRVMSLASSIVSIVRECQRLVLRPPWTLQSSPLPSLLPTADDREASVESAPTLLEGTFCIWQSRWFLLSKTAYLITTTLVQHVPIQPCGGFAERLVFSETGPAIFTFPSVNGAL
jgi:hypothetical protein